MRSLVWVAAATLAITFGITGCGTNDAPSRGGQVPVAAPHADPAVQLREIAEKGKAKAPTSAGKGYTFIDAHVESAKSTSLTYSYIGRIIAEYKDEYGDIDRCVVYFKYEGNKWVFAKYDRGGGGSFPGPLTEDKALTPSSVSEFNSPSGAAPKFTIWLP